MPKSWRCFRLDETWGFINPSNHKYELNLLEPFPQLQVTAVEIETKIETSCRGELSEMEFV